METLRSASLPASRLWRSVSHLAASLSDRPHRRPRHPLLAVPAIAALNGSVIIFELDSVSHSTKIYLRPDPTPFA